MHRNSLSAARVGPTSQNHYALRKRICMQTTQQYCIAETMDLLTNTPNNVLAELQECCDRKLLVLHPEKCKAMILSGNQHFLALSKLFVLATTSIIKWTTSERLLGEQVDNKLPWSDHAANVAKSLASKLSLIPRIREAPSQAIRRLLHKSDTVISYIRPESVGIFQQDEHKEPGEIPCKSWTNYTWVAMGHKC